MNTLITQQISSDKECEGKSVDIAYKIWRYIVICEPCNDLRNVAKKNLIILSFLNSLNKSFKKT